MFFLFKWLKKRKEKRQKKRRERIIHHRAMKRLPKTEVIDIKGRVTANKLNVRQKPSLNARVIGQLKKNQIVEIFNELDEWYQIRWKHNKPAYLYKKYVQKLREEKSGIVLAEVLNVRSKPSLEAQVVGKLRKGDTVVVLKEYPDWLRINYKGRGAFVYKTYIKLKGIPVKPEIPETFFHQRKDLYKIPLEPGKKFPLPHDYHEKIAVSVWNKFGNLIRKISDELKIDLATIVSVISVESGGHGFMNGRLLIRFENHVFWLFWGKNHPEEFAKYFTFDKNNRREKHYFRPSPDADWEVCHTGQDMEWKVLEFAAKLDKEAALKSISMGAPQIMGFNHKIIGYDTVEEMFEKFKKDIRYHILALFDFCKAKPERIRYLQTHNFYKFAYEYNGPTNPKAYEQRLKKYYRLFVKYLS